MIRRHHLLKVLVVAGIAICTFADTRPPYEPPFIDGYYVMAGDFHVHTAFGDGGLPPWDARVEAGRRGLDVIAVTNHNHQVAARLHRRFFRSTSLPLVLTGQEVTAPDHHIVAVGVSTVIDWNQPADATIAAIHAQGGVAIAAHPGSNAAADYGAGALARLDAAERAHPGMRQDGEEGRDRAADYEEFFARAREQNPRIAAVGDSDFHFTRDIGLCRTYLLAREMSESGVLDALRNGRTVAVDDEGNAYGDTALVEIADRARDARAAASPKLWTTFANAAGAAMVWLGLVGLILTGRSSRR
jgi:predicted metal-dependent phosphoesterase TrpH